MSHQDERGAFMNTNILNFKDEQLEVWHLLSVDQLDRDLKRMLRVQLSELVNQVEDYEFEAKTATVEPINRMRSRRRAA